MRAVEWTGAIVDASPSTAVVLVTYSPTRAEIVEANALGVYTWLDLKRGSWAARAAEIIEVLRRRPARSRNRLAALAASSGMTPH